MHVDYVAFNKAWIAKLKEATREDPITGTVYQLTQQGWPHQRRHTPRMARAYWDFRDELSTDYGLLLKGPHIVILSCLHEEYLERLHYGHLSARKVQENARQHLCWPGLDADITDYMRRCQECIRKAHPPREPLQAHDVPSQPWECIAMDHFYYSSRLYLIVCDYFSKLAVERQPPPTNSLPSREVQSEPPVSLTGPPHPPKVKYTASHNNHFEAHFRTTTSSQSEIFPKTPKRLYYQPQEDQETYTISAEGHLQSNQDSNKVIQVTTPQDLPDSREYPIFHKPGSIAINSVEDLIRLYPNSFDSLGI